MWRPMLHCGNANAGREKSTHPPQVSAPVDSQKAHRSLDRSAPLKKRNAPKAAQLFRGFLIALSGSLPHDVSAQEVQNSDVSEQHEGSAGQSAGPDGDVLNVQRLLQLMYQVKTAPGTDANGNLVTTTIDTWKLRADTTFSLSPSWSVALRGDLPFLAKDKYTDSNPNGGFLHGLGDADVQFAIIDKINAQWKVGAGVRLTAPTGDQSIGSG